MRDFLARYVVKPLRPFLLKALALSEKEVKVPRAKRVVFYQREVHVPTWAVAAVAGAMLFAVLFLQVGRGWRDAGALLLMTGLLMVFFITYIQRDLPHIVHDEDAVALLGVILVASVWMIAAAKRLAWLSPHGVPLAAASILTTVLLHPRLAVVITVVLSLVFGVLNDFSFEGVLVACFGGMAAVARAMRVRTRRDIGRAGLWIALAQVATVLMLALLQDWPAGRIRTALQEACIGGALASIIALSVLPSLEIFFSRLTPIRLLELTDVNHPLLKRMSLEAPGTYHHSLIMASLAQAAAEAVGADGLLCRVGAYFHDIGKMVKPEYFVENQGALGNPHDPLPPQMSCLVIQSHVKDGVALARQHGLDKAIVDFITMHHGTSRIEYFYRRALERSADAETVEEDQYRYPGPKPCSRETAILMLADSAEASVRALEDPTHQRITDQIDKIIQAKLGDEQFSEVPLTLSDIDKIKESFINTLVGVYHARIQYPENPASPPAAEK